MKLGEESRPVRRADQYVGFETDELKLGHPETNCGDWRPAVRRELHLDGRPRRVPGDRGRRGRGHYIVIIIVIVIIIIIIITTTITIITIIIIIIIIMIISIIIIVINVTMIIIVNYYYCYV